MESPKSPEKCNRGRVKGHKCQKCEGETKKGHTGERTFGPGEKNSQEMS